MQTVSGQQNNLCITSASNSSYDHLRTLFVLRCIEQILNKCAKEFLTSITHSYLTKSPKNLSATGGNTTASSFSVHNEKLLDLMIRHLKSIYGNSFYSASTNAVANDLSFNLNNVTYIEAIILILMFYIRSYYPPSKFTLLTTSATHLAADRGELSSGKFDNSMRQSSSVASLNNCSNATSSPNVSHYSSPNSNTETANSTATANTSTLSQSPAKTAYDYYNIEYLNKGNADSSLNIGLLKIILIQSFPHQNDHLD